MIEVKSDILCCQERQRDLWRTGPEEGGVQSRDIQHQSVDLPANTGNAAKSTPTGHQGPTTSSLLNKEETRKR